VAGEGSRAGLREIKAVAAEALQAPASQEMAEEGAPAWMTTFADMMSLLLTFFVLMYSMSEVRSEKFAAAATSLNTAFTGMGLSNSSGSPAPDIEESPEPPAVAPPVSGEKMQLDSIADAYLDIITQRLLTMIRERQLEETLTVEKTADGVELRVSTSVFPSGSAVLSPDRSWIVNELGEITATLGVPAVVTGHTDDAPIQTSTFQSNWELSAARAAGVARVMVDMGHNPRSIRVEAYGEHRPLVPNETDEDRATNRRVEIFFSRTAIEELLRARAAGVAAGN